MTATQQNRFKKMLETKRTDLRREIAAQRGRLSVDLMGDAMDQGRGIAERDLAFQSAGRTSATLRLVEGALREIGENTFGTCTGCGNEIPTKRLEAVPWTPYCVACQERAELDGQEGERDDHGCWFAMAS